MSIVNAIQVIDTATYTLELNFEQAGYLLRALDKARSEAVNAVVDADWRNLPEAENRLEKLNHLVREVSSMKAKTMTEANAQL